MPSLHILVVDDEPAVRQILAAAVAKAGYSVDEAANAAEAAAKLARGDVDVALCDVKLPDGSGIDLVRDSRAAGTDAAFIMITAFASLETAIDALRAGAADYIVKPVRNEEVLHRLSQIATLRGLSEENQALREAVSAAARKIYRFSSPQMLKVEHMANRVAPTDSTVLITGESGTGKGVMARSIHAQSGRRRGPFVAVNCSAIPEHLLEAEFFGCVKGAFTGADRARKGLLLQASGGTLFLDEIGELPPPMQAKLLNVIEDKEVRPLGSEQVRRVDTRIIAATNTDLAERVRQGRFREDLYFRLGVLHIAIPPLRERPADLRDLIRHLLNAPAPGNGGSRVTEIDPGAEELLLAHAWPGNVRELEHVINRARLLAEGDSITVADLPSALITRAAARREPAQADPPADEDAGAEGNLHGRLKTLERDIVRRAVAAAGGDRRVAARRLGIGLSSLYRKLDEREPTE
jgi:two-component system, NtrC family, response regulator AtoC